MSSHRYWRLTNIVPQHDTALVLTECALLDGTTPVATAPTASLAPSAGTLASLIDASAVDAVSWSRTYGLVLHWDLGAATEVNDLRLGSSDAAATFPRSCVLEYSDDDTAWSNEQTYNGIAWPGPRTIPSVVVDGLPVIQLHASFFAPSLGMAVPYSGSIHEALPRALRNFLVDRDGGTIAGTVKEKNLPDNTPLRRRVRLYRERDGRLVQETWSDAATGAYIFYRVDTLERYTVLSYDHLHNYRAAVADNLIPT